jgi:mannose-6-phosphate isomerase-like protein (cupin superfamily)
MIEEFVGRVNSGTTQLSVARMTSPPGWNEPGQRPDFDEITVVLSGTLRVEGDRSTIDVGAGEAVYVERGDWVKYSTPCPEGAEYIAVCIPAFSPETVNRSG